MKPRTAQPSIQIPNTQTPEILGEYSSSIDIIKIWRTIQGEGPFAGSPAIFVRVAGCQLCCPFCDTNYTIGRHKVEIPEIINEILEERVNPFADLIVITGGEPLRQPSLIDLCDWLIGIGFDVQIETNGVWFLELPDEITVVISPKTPKIHKAWHKRQNTFFKYIVQHGETDPRDGMPLKVLGKSGKVALPTYNPRSIFIQPLDEKDEEANKRNLDEAVKVCLTHGYRLSVQMQKIVGLE